MTQLYHQSPNFFQCIGFASLPLSTCAFYNWRLTAAVRSIISCILLPLDFVRTISCLELFYYNSLASSLKCQSYLCSILLLILCPFLNDHLKTINWNQEKCKLFPCLWVVDFYFMNLINFPNLFAS